MKRIEIQLKEDPVIHTCSSFQRQLHITLRNDTSGH